MSLQAEWQYLLQTVLGVGEYMVPVEEAISNKFLPKLMGIHSISGRLRKFLALGARRAGIVILEPMEAAGKSHKILQACYERLVSLLMGEALSTAKRRACVKRGSSNGREWKKDSEEDHLAREMLNQNNRGKMRLGVAKITNACLTVVPDLLNGTTLLVEEFQDNLII